MLILLNKPFNVLCQFTGEPGQQTLAGFIPVPGVYAAGRLDADSEGLLVLTDDGALQQRIAELQEMVATVRTLASLASFGVRATALATGRSRSAWNAGCSRRAWRVRNGNVRRGLRCGRDGG